MATSVVNCENCGRVIGSLETPHIHQGHVVCRECKERLDPSQVRPTPANIRTSPAVEGKTRSAGSKSTSGDNEKFHRWRGAFTVLVLLLAWRMGWLTKALIVVGALPEYPAAARANFEATADRMNERVDDINWEIHHRAWAWADKDILDRTPETQGAYRRLRQSLLYWGTPDDAKPPEDMTGTKGLSAPNREPPMAIPPEDMTGTKGLAVPKPQMSEDTTGPKGLSAPRRPPSGPGFVPPGGHP